MDPNETLRRIRACIKTILEDENHENDATVINLVDYVEALDMWITRGGFLPGAWER